MRQNEMERKIDLLARRLSSVEGLLWSGLTEQEKDDWWEQARLAAMAFAPELFTDPPQAWLAPWEATEKILAAVVFPEFRPEHWDALRDAYLSPTPTEEE